MRASIRAFNSANARVWHHTQYWQGSTIALGIDCLLLCNSGARAAAVVTRHSARERSVQQRSPRLEIARPALSSACEQTETLLLATSFPTLDARY